MRLRPTFLLFAALAAMATVPAAVAFPATPVGGATGCLTSAPASHRMVSPRRVVEPVDADAPGGAVSVANPTSGSTRVEVAAVEPGRFDRRHVPPVGRLHLRERATHPANAPPSRA